MMTEQRFDMWTTLWGTLEWDGVFAPENLTYEAEGNDPTGGNPYRISKAAFIEGDCFLGFTFVQLIHGTLIKVIRTRHTSHSLHQSS